jgi:hypothetical protein
METVKCFITSLVIILLSVTVSSAQDIGWPRQRTENGNTLITYQPQVDAWLDFRELDWRMAISLTPAGGKPALGVVELHGQTIVDNDNKIVLIANLKIKRTHFPSLDPAAEAQMDRLTRRFLPSSVTITLQQLVACVPKPESVHGVQLKNDPPVIYVSYKPAILLDVDGKPVRTAIPKGKLEYVVNTHWPLFFDPQSSMFYLLAGEQWLTAASLQGPWKSAKKLPRDMNILIKDPAWKDLKKFVPPPPAKANAVVPVVFYSTSPAEVILLNGKPAYAQIPGTRLKYATNTTSYLFLYTPTNQYYYLTAGRWFRASSLGGPWSFATPNLPEDFTHIPPSSPTGQVLASVPGTEEAKDAVLLAQIPTTVIVNPAAAATVKVTYVNDPQFVPIEGTTLYYAKNSPQTVIKVGDLYYLCFQGIWFVSANPKGPWQTARTVPSVIYTIPPSSPVYHVTYVTQVTTSNGNVQASYTSGYIGVYVMSTSSVVVVTCGTGYYYPSYVYVYPAYRYPVYYPPPYTYGYRTYYYSPTGAYGVSQTVYGPYGSATRTASYNPYTGTYTRTASVSTPYGSAAAGRAYNPYTGAAAATRQGSNAYESWGSSVVTKGGKSAYTKHYSNEKGTVGSVKTSTGGKAVGASTERGKTFVGKTGGGDVYAGHDGNVYKKTGSGWQKYENGSWSSAEKPAPVKATQQPTQKAAQQSSTTSRQTSAQQQGQQQAKIAQQKTQASEASRESYQNQAQQRSSSSGLQGGNDQLQGLQKEAQNRQRGAEERQRFQNNQRSDGTGSRGGGSRSRR